ncbi:MAG: hypothetical protein ACKV2U_31695 [Bryobacteraceae bacterium]
MRTIIYGLMAAGTLAAQSVGGPVLGYVVDGGARMRPLNGMPAAAHVGAAIQEGVRDTWGELALLIDGTAMLKGQALEGRWASLQPGAFLDAAGREVLVTGESVTPWRLTLPERALAVRVSTSGERVLTLLADERLAAWTVGGKAEYSFAVSAWWSFAFAGERAMAYDPAANSLFWIDAGSGMTLLRKLAGDGGRYALAVDAAGKTAVLLSERALVVPVGGGDVTTIEMPEGAGRLEAMRGGRAYLLTRDPARPLWVLDPESENPLLVIPALENDNGAQR